MSNDTWKRYCDAVHELRRLQAEKTQSRRKLASTERVRTAPVTVKCANDIACHSERRDNIVIEGGG